MFDYLFEASWEVANKVGGIHTVLEKKARYLVDRYGKKYFLLGPYLKDQSEKEFRELPPPPDCEACVVKLKEKGIEIHYGEWLVQGRPQVILVDFEGLRPQTNQLKYHYWEKFGVDSIRAGADFNDPLLWAHAVGEYVAILAQQQRSSMILHTHEWLAGTALLKVHDLKNVVKIFTTHATVLGRTLASAGVNFYDSLEGINSDQEAFRFHIEAKHLLEKAAAWVADKVSTVSELTAPEVQQFLKRRVDAILPNGIDFERFPSFEESAYHHRKNREAIRRFLLYYFSPYYRSEVEEGLLYFITGRKEIRNKGIDIFVKSLGALNRRLREEKSNKTVFAFLFIPDYTRGPNPELVENLTIYHSLEDRLEALESEIVSRLFHALIHEEQVNLRILMSESTLLDIQRTLGRIKRAGFPPIATHLLDPTDEIGALLREADLDNAPADRVKIIYYPIYLQPTDGFLNLNYEEVMSGCHLGVFPSFYEPWGYTPLETAAAGVSAVTTDLSGFGRFLQSNAAVNPQSPGIFIIRRAKRSEGETIQDLADSLYAFAQSDRPGRVQNKLEARRLAALASWERLIKNYFKLYEQA